MQEHPLELITLEQFAKRLNISRSTAYNWLAEGRLVPGRHIVRVGRVIRVIWSEELVKYLLSLSALEEREHSRLRRHGHGGKNHIAMDINYLESD
jgi:excisionase family DNA binding protein